MANDTAADGNVSHTTVGGDSCGIYIGKGKGGGSGEVKEVAKKARKNKRQNLFLANGREIMMIDFFCRFGSMFW